MNQTITIVDETATKMTLPTSHSEGRMWPSLETATRLFDAFSIALAIGACVVFVATAAIVWLGIVKEHHWDELREQARTKVATLETETARANVEVARAHENTAKLSVEAESARAAIADANARALEAQAELAKFKAPRSLSPEQQRKISESFKRFAGQKYSFNVFQDPEAIELMRSINGVLKQAGWTRIGSQVGDLEIEGAGASSNLGLLIGLKKEASPALQNLAMMLADALTGAGLPTKAMFFPDLKFDDALNIVVGKKQ